MNESVLMHLHELKSILFAFPWLLPKALCLSQDLIPGPEASGLLRLLLPGTLSQASLVLTVTVVTAWVRYFLEFPATEVRLLFSSQLSLVCRAGGRRRR